MSPFPIDFVVTWLDSSDPEWQKAYQHYSPYTSGDKNKARFRDMDLFYYWFRSIEKNAPWVHKIYLVTNGTFPDWINREHPKLVLVKHEDYIPQELLPTFNSCTIELHMHRIKGLSEHFVYFNDDVLLNAPMKPDDYFKKGLPCDLNKETCLNVPIYTKKDRFGIIMSMMADIGVVNRHFRRWDTVRKSPWRWFGPHLGIKGFIMSCMLAKQRLFVGFSNRHMEQVFLKNIFEDVWEKEPEFMTASCTRFREDVIANPYIFRYWQFAKNMFYPHTRKGAFFFLTEKKVVDEVRTALSDPNIDTICLNDSSLCSDEDYIIINQQLREMLQKKFPKKSAFEK